MKVHYFTCIILLTAGNAIILHFRYNHKNKELSGLSLKLSLKIQAKQYEFCKQKSLSDFIFSKDGSRRERIGDASFLRNMFQPHRETT